LTVTHEPLRDRFRSRAGVDGGPPAQAPAGIEQRPRQPHRGEPLAPRDRLPSQYAREQMKRRRYPRAAQRRPHSGFVVARQLERRLPPDVPRRADAIEELERRAVTTEEDVLAVVHELTGLAIGERGRTAAELRARFEDEHLQAGFGQHGRRAQAGKPRAHDDDVVVVRRHAASIVRAQTAAAMATLRGLGIRTTSRNTS
jgi:hypothetical protein